jgi:hypothetical protein
MKFVVVGLVLAAIVALEVASELASGHDSDALVCMAPESQRESLRETLLLHLTSH